jgi:hypothetical protein
MIMKPFCNDLKIAVQEYQKEIDEHGIKDEKTLRANKALVDAFGGLCTTSDPLNCDDLKHAAENWREEIDRFSNFDVLKGKIPVIPLFGWIQGKGVDYYKRIQNGVDSAVKELGCK